VCHLGPYIKDIKHAVSKLKPNKSEGSSALASDHVVNAGDNFICHIAYLFTLFVVHGYVPECFLSRLYQFPKAIM